VLRAPRYVIAVPDLERSTRDYRDVRGFDVREVGDPGWRFFVRDDCFMMAGECPDAIPADQLGDRSYFAYVVVDGIAELYKMLTARGATLVKHSATSRGACASSVSAPSTATG